MCGATREHRPTTFWPYHPHGVSAYSVFLCAAQFLAIGFRKTGLKDSICQTAYSIAVKTTVRVLTTSMMTTLCLSVKAVGQLGYKEMY